MPRTYEGALETLRTEGVARGPAMPPSHAEALAAHLRGCQVYDAHVRAKSRHGAPWGDGAGAGWPMFCHDMRDVMMAPHLLELALETLPVARDYFGEPPKLYSLNAFWTQQARGEHSLYQDTHGWHRDGDDRKQLVLFVYGTHVLAQQDGAHLYQRGSHLVADDKLGRDFREPPQGEIAVVLGIAGTTFLADTGGLHLGLRPQHGRRMLAWARWGVSDPPQSYVWDQLSPLPRHRLGARYPSDPVLQEAIRLVVR